MPPLPSLTVIVLNWNGRSYLPSCLHALADQDYPTFQTVLVDNASTDDSVAFVQTHFPQTTIIQNKTNLGFAAGNNVALRQLQTDMAVLLNPDVVLAPDALRQMALVMQQDPQIGIVGCKLHYPGGRLIQHAGGYLTPPQAMPGHFGILEEDKGQYDAQRDVEYVIGAAMAIRQEALTAVNHFDEGYFLYFEDTDFCTKARQAGFRVVYAPIAHGIHVESAVTRKESLSYTQRFHSGRWRYLLKHQPLTSLLTETVAAEHDWLGKLDKAQQTMMLLVYGTIRGQIPAICQERGEEAVPFYRVLETLSQRVLALQEQDDRLVQLEAQAVVEERPFASNTPIIGFLIVRFREAWNSVAAKWHVRPLLQQQNAFNQLVAQQLREQQAWLRSQQQGWQISETSELLAEISRLQQQIAVLQTRLDELERRGK